MIVEKENLDAFVQKRLTVEMLNINYQDKLKAVVFDLFEWFDLYGLKVDTTWGAFNYRDRYWEQFCFFDCLSAFGKNEKRLEKMGKKKRSDLEYKFRFEIFSPDRSDKYKDFIVTFYLDIDFYIVSFEYYEDNGVIDRRIQDFYINMTPKEFFEFLDENPQYKLK